MAALGVDIWGVEDISPFLNLVDPQKAVAQAVARSLLHAIGRLWWAVGRGFDLRQQLHRFLDSLETLQLGIQQEIDKEERVQSSTVTLTKQSSQVDAVINLILTQDETAVTLTLKISLVDGALQALVN